MTESIPAELWDANFMEDKATLSSSLTADTRASQQGASIVDRIKMQLAARTHTEATSKVAMLSEGAVPERHMVPESSPMLC